MIRHQVIQNTPDWIALRLGIPTASEFHRIVCPELGNKYVCQSCSAVMARVRKNCSECDGTIAAVESLKASTQAEAYMHKLLAEWALDCPLEDQTETEWMARGHELEPQAMRAYAFERGVDPVAGGFFTTDDGLCGSSPDFEVGEPGLLELKCPAPQTHIGYMLQGEIDPKYTPQVQGQMLVCEREWVDLQSYHPSFPTVIIRHARDEKYIGLLRAALREFCDKMLAARERLTREYGPFRRQKREAAQKPPSDVHPFDRFLGMAPV